jgi:hypothetical protein
MDRREEKSVRFKKAYGLFVFALKILCGLCQYRPFQAEDTAASYQEFANHNGYCRKGGMLWREKASGYTVFSERACRIEGGP